MPEEIEFKVSLGGNLPKELANGWDDQALLEKLFSDRRKPRYAVVQYNVNAVTEKTADDSTRLTLQLLRVEPVGDGWVEEDLLRELVITLFERRTNQVLLFSDEEGAGVTD